MNSRLDPSKNICVYCFRDQGNPDKLERHMNNRSKKCLQLEQENTDELIRNCDPEYLLKLVKEDFDKRIEISSNLDQATLDKIRAEKRHLRDD